MKRFLRGVIAIAAVLLCFFGSTVDLYADDSDYGKEAYELLKVISTDYKYRTSDARKDPDLTKKQRMLAFLDAKMAEYGYQVNRELKFPCQETPGAVF